jgi:Skp family chaperone for outer membrane proteins
VQETNPHNRFRHIVRLGIAGAGVAALLLTVNPRQATAQASQDYFIPGQQHQGPAGHPSPRAAQRPQTTAPMMAPPVQLPAPQQGGPAVGAEAPPPTPQMQMQLPAAPELPPLPKGPAPPAAVVGVLGVPEVMRSSTAAQQVEKAIGERRQKLNEDAQKEQAVWRDLQQQLSSQRANLSPEQIRSKERELQERITNAQRVFRERNRVIQEAAQYGLAQIERTLVSVIRQVAESRGMNLVLHRAQVALNVNEFDLTDEVTAQLNKVLPSVTVPPEGQEPPMTAVSSNPPSAQPTASSQPAGAAPSSASPASEPASSSSTPTAAAPGPRNSQRHP